MAKYNILRDKDGLSENRENIEKRDIKAQTDDIKKEEPAYFPDPTEEEKNTPGDDFFSDEIFSAIEDEKPEPVSEIPIKQEEL